MRNQMLIAAVASALIGCVGGIQDQDPDDPPDDPPGDESPRELFNRTVMPKLAQCSACHVGPSTQTTNPFLGEVMSSADGYYGALEADRGVIGGWVPAAATILTKGQHTGPAWSPGDAEIVTAWITAEQLIRGVDTTPTPPGNPATTARGAMMQWAQCLSVSQAEYEATQAYNVANMQSESGACRQCHNLGAGGTLLMPQGQRLDMLSHWQEEVFLQGVFTPAIQAGSPVTYKMVAAEGKFCGKGLEKENNQGTHPSFNCQQNGLNQLKEFVTQVTAKMDAGACGTPAAFKEPTPL